MKYLVLSLLALAIILPFVIQDADAGGNMWISIHTDDNRYFFEDNYQITIKDTHGMVIISLYSFEFNEQMDNLYNDVVNLDELSQFTAYSLLNSYGFSQILFDDCMIYDVKYTNNYKTFHNLSIELVCIDEPPIDNYLLTVIHTLTETSVYTILWNGEFYLSPTNPAFESQLVALDDFDWFEVLDAVLDPDGNMYYIVSIDGIIYHTYTLNAPLDEMILIGPE